MDMSFFDISCKSIKNITPPFFNCSKTPVLTDIKMKPYSILRRIMLRFNRIARTFVNQI